MSKQKQLIRRMGPGAILVVLVGLGAGDPPRTITAGGLSFEVPTTWKVAEPSSRMRLAELKVEPVAGDKDEAELVVFGFPGGAGSIDANVKRWQTQFRDSDGNPPKVVRKTVRGKNTEVTQVETSGLYVPMQTPGRARQPEKPNYRLLGAIVQTDTFGYFLKMVGPDRTIAAARPAFDSLIVSIKVTEK